MIKTEQLVKNYGRQEVLKGVSLEVKPGEVYCLLGANGAGKSTTINILLNFIKPDGGKAYIHNIDVGEKPLETKKHLAYIPEIVMLYPMLSGLENVRFFSALSGFSYSDEELSAFLQRAGLQETAFRKRLKSYSKGMRQKVGIAIAIAKNAGALIMDEPTSGLDPKATDEFTGTIQSFCQEGRAVLMATHDIFNAVNVGTHIGIIKHGTIVHSLKSNEINATDLQRLYLETIQ
ncbi:ATP-binding cassette domain-containing protein [Marinilongibacter aquaticus]|uniref:ABC transporter ATP-binding protein n=1 Tax=Marinilongibacter aquaticus TaxID=2975157 RepID=UPI0021BDA2A9|nr:ATP-binding cassette domain-containing protein [Marinilongibacter aquaticus]UBM58613.1 ATP-binding cassette domain-containing protein [Marinilongibacter aquaticus]